MTGVPISTRRLSRAIRNRSRRVSCACGSTCRERRFLPASPRGWKVRPTGPRPTAELAGDLPPRRASADLLRLFDGQRGVIWAAEFANFYGRISYLFPSWPPGTRWNSDRRRAASMKSFREMLAFARRNEIDLRLFISPVHARYLDWYERAGWWPMFEAWKRALVSAIDEESNSASDQPAIRIVGLQRLPRSRPGARAADRRSLDAHALVPGHVPLLAGNGRLDPGPDPGRRRRGSAPSRRAPRTRYDR